MKEDYDKAVIADRPESPLEKALNNQDEIISAIEKQLSVLGERLNPISSHNERDGSDSEATPGLPGDSRVVARVNDTVYRLRNASDKISILTRELEV